MAIGFAREFGWGKKDHLRFAYDFEDANDQPPAKVAKHAVEFVRAYEGITGEFPVFYTMPGFWQGVVGHLDQSDRHLIGRCPLWIAHWRVEKPTVPKPWNDFCLWQHDDSGRVPGHRHARRRQPHARRADRAEDRLGRRRRARQAQGEGRVRRVARRRPRPAGRGAAGEAAGAGRERAAL